MKRKQRYQGKRTAPLTKRQRFWAEWGHLFVTVLVVIVLFRVVLQLAWVPSGSMEATIPTRSMLVSMRLPYMMGDPQPERGDRDSERKNPDGTGILLRTGILYGSGRWN